ncbi:MAG: CpaF family protein [Lachnospiraceae bacterium]|nr:CpaF family protein [Lachnospiraceae bacterium]
MNFEEIKETIRAGVVVAMDFSRELTDEEVLSLIDEGILKFETRGSISLGERIRLKREIFNSLRKLDIIQEYLEDDRITEIMINGREGIFLEKNGRVIRSEKCFKRDGRLEDIVQQIVAGCNRSVNEASPIADARLPSGERVNIVLPPVAINGPIVTIRRFPSLPINMDRLVEIGSVTKEAAAFLKRLVIAGYNIFISGGTGSGKTTFLNALSQFIPSKERIITIEDSAELKLLNAENLVRLEARIPNSEEARPISIRELIKTALRMRPERIVVGECRGEEALDMLQAMNTGHDGSLSTGHANSSKDMLSRLETMVLMGAEIPISAIRSQIAGGIDVMVHLTRMRDGSRKVTEISEIMGIREGEIDLKTLFLFDGRDLVKKGELTHKDKLFRAFETGEVEKIL